MLILVKYIESTNNFLRGCLPRTGIVFFSVFCLSVLCQTRSNADDQLGRPIKKNAGKIGRGKRSIQLKTCQVTYSGQGLSEGDLAEVIDSSGQRIAVVKLERPKAPNAKLLATVVLGEDKCGQIAGLSVRPFSSGNSLPVSSPPIEKNAIVALAPKMMLAQAALPGLALNKFLSPGYTQKGYAIQGLFSYPRDPFKLGPLAVNFNSEVVWFMLNTSPSLDILKNSIVEGSQNVSTNSLNLRVGARLYYLDLKSWSGFGLVPLNSIQTSSSVNSTTGSDADKLLRVVRDVKSQGFGIYGEQGFTVGGSAIFSLHGGLGISTSIKTPVVADGDSTNSSESGRMDGLPYFAGAKVHLPLLNWLFAEVNLDYRKYSFSIPLVNDGITKAQFDLMTFSGGIGLRY